MRSKKIGRHIIGHERFEHWNTSPEQLTNALAKQNSLSLGDLITLLYKIELGESKPRWGDKTPGYERHFDQLAKVFPNAKFIHIHRDGRDVSNSMCDRNWHGVTEFQRANYWRRSIDLAFEASERLGPDRCLNVQYETLVKSPEATLTQICQFLGERYESQMLDFTNDASDRVVDQTIHTKLDRMPDPDRDLQRWKRESNSIRVLLFEALAGKSLKRAGYDLRFHPSVGLFAKFVYWLPGKVIALVHEAYLSSPARWRSVLRQNKLFRSLRNMIYRRRLQSVEAKSA